MLCTIYYTYQYHNAYSGQIRGNCSTITCKLSKGVLTRTYFCIPHNSSIVAIPTGVSIIVHHHVFTLHAHVGCIMVIVSFSAVLGTVNHAFKLDSKASHSKFKQSKWMVQWQTQRVYWKPQRGQYTLPVCLAKLREIPPLARLMCRPWAKLDSETRTVYPVYAVTAQRSYLHFQMRIASLRLNDSPQRASGICFRYLRRDAAQRTRDKTEVCTCRGPSRPAQDWAIIVWGLTILKFSGIHV